MLLVEDSAAEAELVADPLAFARAPGFAFRHAARLGDAVRMLGAEHFDVVLLDLGLLDASGPDGLAAIHRPAPGAAIVVRTGSTTSGLRSRPSSPALRTTSSNLKRGAGSDHGIERPIHHALARRLAEDNPLFIDDELVA